MSQRQRLTEEQFNEEYEAFIQQQEPISDYLFGSKIEEKLGSLFLKQPMEDIFYVIEDKKNKGFQLFLKENMLYIDTSEAPVRVYAAGFKSNKHTIIKSMKAWSRKAWSWQLTEEEHNLLCLVLESPKERKKILNDIIAICGCTQVSSTPSADFFVKHDYETAQKTLNALKNFSRLLAKRAFQETEMGDKKYTEATIYQHILDRLYKNKGISDTCTSHFLTLMYYYLNQYLAATKMKLTVGNLDFALALSFCFVNKLTEDNAFDDKSIAVYFKVSRELLSREIMNLLQITCSESANKEFRGMRREQDSIFNGFFEILSLFKPAKTSVPTKSPKPAKSPGSPEENKKDVIRTENFPKLPKYSVEKEGGPLDIYVPTEIYQSLREMFEMPVDASSTQAPILRAPLSVDERAKALKSLAPTPTPHGTPNIKHYTVVTILKKPSASTQTPKSTPEIPSQGVLKTSC